MEQPSAAVDYEIEYAAKRLTCNSVAAETPAVDVVAVRKQTQKISFLNN